MTDNKPVQRTITFSSETSNNANANAGIESGISPGLKRRSLGGGNVSHLEQKHEALNHLFGFIPTAVPVTHRPLEARSTTVQKLYEPPKKVLEDVQQESLLSVSNVIWTLFFGWWLYLVYVIVTIVLCISIVGFPYAKITWMLKDYYWWPFGKYIIRRKSVKVDDESPLINENSGSLAQTPRKYIYPKEPVLGKIAWMIFGVPVLSLAHLISFVFCWLPVILIPMAKVNMESIRLFFRNPLQLVIEKEYPGARADVRLCGVNVILVNLLPFVFVTLFCGYVLPAKYKPDPEYLFFTALLSVVPLAYYIGMAISSISAQTSLAVGALLNASFGSLSELILFGIAISTGSLDKLVQYSLTGSLLCTMLLTPGLAIMFGGLKYKEQQFNPASTGVSSTLLIISMIGVFSPTIYYVCFGSYNLDCSNCTTIDGHMNCAGCKYTETEITTDPIYLHGAKPLMYTSCVIMPIAYIIGMVFTLKTHAHLFEEDMSEAEAEDAPEWPLWKGILILVIATILDAMISEELISAVQPAMKVLGLSESFVGVFLLGGVANVSEVINAVNFALTDNIALSIELGMAATVQTALMQLPALILLAGVVGMFVKGVAFTLIFPLLNVFAIIFAVITVNYVYISGKTNYFEGAALVLVYILFVIAFYFVPS